MTLKQTQTGAHELSKPSDHPDFKALLKEWNRKLYESEFHDEEVYCNGELVLKAPGSARRYQRMDAVTREAKEQYFRQVAQHVAETTFTNDLEAQILTLYAQGFSKARIKRTLGIQGHRCKVYYPIYKWLKAWGMK